MQFQIDLPPWAIKANEALPDRIESVEARMATVIEFSRQNVRHQTGGPFAAGVFEKETGKVIVVGVNRVMPANVSSAHAEIVTLSLAQTILGTHDLGGPDMPAYQLVVNAQPCAMCFGSLPWSGIRSVVTGASGEEVESITGFDEGPIHPGWKDELIQRDIDVTTNVMSAEACDVLREFVDSGGPIYNGRNVD